MIVTRVRLYVEVELEDGTKPVMIEVHDGTDYTRKVLDEGVKVGSREVLSDHMLEAMRSKSAVMEYIRYVIKAQLREVTKMTMEEVDKRYAG